MKNIIITNVIYLLIGLILITLINNFLSFSYWPLYLGGVVGLFIPHIDHLLYVFVFNPHQLTSQRVKILISQKQYKQALSLLYDTKDERKDLIFHTTNFQIIFIILAFWVIFSSSSLFGKGLVFAFFQSLVVSNFKQGLINLFRITLLLLILFIFLI